MVLVYVTLPYVRRTLYNIIENLKLWYTVVVLQLHIGCGD